MKELKMQDVAVANGNQKRRRATAITSTAALGIAAVLAFPLASNAYERVTVNGRLFACQNSCMVSTMRGGGFIITDSKGGWTTQIAVNGEVIVYKDR